MRVAVVGGGAVGVTAARDLAAAGEDVTLYERDAVGAGSTGRAAGVVCAAAASEVDAGMLDRAADRFRALSGSRGFRFHETPYVWFVTEAGDAADGVREEVAAMRDNGCDAALLDADELRTRYPQLHTEDVHLAGVTRDAGVADPSAYVELVADRAAEAGATLRTGTPATVAADPARVTAEGSTERYDAVLVAAGAQSGRVLAGAGLRVPVAAYRTQALRCSGPAVPTLYDLTAGYYVRPHSRGLIAGAGVDAVDSLDDRERDADAEFADELRARLERRFVNFSTSVGRAWAGLCTATPDGNPLLGRAADGVYVATGWRGAGFARAPAAGERIAAQIRGGDGVPAFDPGRFDGDEAITVAGRDLA